MQGIVAGYTALIQNNSSNNSAATSAPAQFSTSQQRMHHPHPQRLPPPPPPPVVPFASFGAAPAVAAAANSGWTSSVPRVQIREQAAMDAAARYSSNALQPLHPSLTATARPHIQFKLAQPIRFVSKGTINTDATQPTAASESSASASAAAAAAASSASSIAIAAPAVSHAAQRHFARARPSSSLPSSLAVNVAAASPPLAPLTRLERKLQTLLCSVLTAAPDASLRLRDMSAALLTYTGEEWEDLTTQPIEGFIRQHSVVARGGPFRLQEDAQHPGDPLVSCQSAESQRTEASEQKSQQATAVMKMEVGPAEETSTTAVVAAAAAAPSAPAVAAAAAPSTAAVAASAFRSYCVLISNIPSSFHSADLRHFFSNLVEAGRFKIFQPTHRNEETKTAEATTETTDAAAATSEQPQAEQRRFEAIAASAVAAPAPHAGGPWKCLAQLRKKADVERMLGEFDRKEWVSQTGEHTGERCSVRFIPLPRRLLRHTEAATAAAMTQDLTGEAEAEAEGQGQGQPGGDVIDLTDDVPSAPVSSSSSSSAAAAAAAAAVAAASTAATSIDADETPEEAAASREILAAYSAGEFAAPAFLPQGLVGTPTKTIHANIAHLPPSLLKRLHLTPVVESINAKRFKFAYAASSSFSSAAAAVLPAADVDDDPVRVAARGRAACVVEEGTQEEWDRDLDQGVRSTNWDSGRGLAKIGDQTLFEDPVDQPGDKGDASGLVHYTDAQREQEARGDFDEQNVDMFDVEIISSDDDDVQEDDGPEARARRKQLAASKMRERMTEASVVSARQASESAAAAAASSRDRSLAWSKSDFLQKMMSKQGFLPGQGLGKRNQGIAEPIQPVNKGSTRGGLGFDSADNGGGGGGGGRQRNQGISAPAANNFYRQLSGKLKKKRKSYAGMNGGALGQGGYDQAADFRAFQRSQGLR